MLLLRRRSRPTLLLLAALALLTGLAGPASAYPGAPWFEPGVPYAGNFPDPSVLRVGSTYYAYSTATGGSYLPTMSSTDLVHWTPRAAYDGGAAAAGDHYFNDGLLTPARWGVDLGGTGRTTKEVWAPGVFAYGGRYLAFYAVRVAVSPRRTCISVATSASPAGPFADTSSGPVVCDADPAGSIDPQPFVDPATGAPYLAWKSEGQSGVRPARLWSQRLDSTGTGLLAGAPRRMLLQTAQAWEGRLVENPSMVFYGRAWWLFYSANEWASARYAVGVARCAGPLGPCRRSGSGPLLASSGDRLGPGGATAFVDTAGRLRLAYHYWNGPYTSYPSYTACAHAATCEAQGQRRLAIAGLRIDGTGHLRLS